MDISIRKWTFDDLDNLVKHANNKNVSSQLRNIFPYPYSRKSGEGFLDICINHSDSQNLLLAIDVDGQAVGGINLGFGDDVNCKCAGLGYWLGEDYWRKGIATEAVRLICDKGFAEYDIVRIYAETYDTNLASRKVLEKCGFEQEGLLRKSIFKNGHFYDCCVYGKIR